MSEQKLAEHLHLHIGDELLHYLADRPDHAAAVVELPERLQDPDMLTVCDADGLIEFGDRGPAARVSRDDA